MAGETQTAPPTSTFVEQVKAWQTGKPAPAAGTPAPDSPAPASATPPAASPTPAEFTIPAELTLPDPGSPAPPADQTPPPGDQPPAAPADSGAPPETAPPVDPNADKRVSDAQRKMHEATARAKAAEDKVAAALAENTTLRTQITSLLTRPDLQPVTASEAAFDLDAAVTQAAEAYQTAPDDKAAIGTLIRQSVELGKTASLAEVRREAIARENQARLAARQALVRQSVNQFVEQFDPTLPLPLFWAVLPLAEAETPAELTSQDAIADWQVKRAIAKATAILESRTEQVRETTLHTERTQRAAGVVMPGGGSAAPITPTPQPQRPRSMVEAVNDLQRRTMPAA